MIEMQRLIAKAKAVEKAEKHAQAATVLQSVARGNRARATGKSEARRRR